MSVRIAAPELLALARDLLAAAGASAEQAQAVADALVWSDLAGRGSQGVWRLPILCRRLRQGGIRGAARPVFEQLGPGVGRVHGKGGAGHHVAALAMDHAIGLAREQGIGAVSALDSNYFGAAAYYVNRAATAGMIGIAASNSFAKVLAHGGRRPALGTNPIAFGAPRASGEAVLVDMATSGAAGSTARIAPATLQAGVTVDASGALLPLGGAKGYALGVMIEILCGVLAGPGIGATVRSMYGEPGRAGANGHFMLAIDIQRFLPIELFHGRMDELAAGLQASGDPGVIRLPGAQRWHAYRNSLACGIALDASTAQAVLALCCDSGLAPPACLVGLPAPMVAAGSRAA